MSTMRTPGGTAGNALAKRRTYRRDWTVIYRYRHQTQVEYVCNTNGEATVADFVDDWAPIGRQVWNDLVADGMAYADEPNGTIRLTAAGRDLLSAIDFPK